MKFTLHKIKELKTFDISIVSMNEEEAKGLCEKVIKELKKVLSSDRYKYECIGQFAAENLQSSYHYTITFEMSSKEINQTIEVEEAPNLTVLAKKMKKFCETFQNFNVEIDPSLF